MDYARQEFGGGEGGASTDILPCNDQAEATVDVYTNAMDDNYSDWCWYGERISTK